MENLSQRLAQGHSAAFAELYDACADRIHHYLVVRLGSREDADDVLQETFVRLSRNRRRLAGVKSLMAYVFTVARNEAARLARRSRRTDFKSVPHTGSLPAAEDLFCAAQSDVEASETAESVAKALAQLEPPLREVVELKVYAGLMFREIAAVTGSPQGTVATRYRTALGKMRGYLVREES